MARKRDLPCADCGELLWSGSSSLPAGRARCRPCRRARPTTAPRRYTCKRCGIEFERTGASRGYCSLECWYLTSRGPRISAPNDARTSRRAREEAAPGLTRGARVKLLRRWQRQQRACLYCDARATTMDHVLPLVRGGTNHEGNLAPACKRCNSSKGGKTVIEWRTGKRLPPMTEPLPWCYVTARVKAEPKPTPVRSPCPMCEGTVPPPRRVYCTDACATEAFNRYVRDKYRKRVGLPVDPSMPTKAFARNGRVLEMA